MIDLTPLDVRNKRGDFKKKLGGGYDPAEVDVFLELVAERLEQLVRENLQYRERAETLQQQVQSQSGREQAQREADHILKEAETEGRRMMAEAEAEARRQLRDAERRLEQGQDALVEMERRRSRFLKSFRQLLERELDVVEVEEQSAPLEDRPIDLDLGGGRSAEPAPAPPPVVEDVPAVDTDPAERPPMDAAVDELAAGYGDFEAAPAENPVGWGDMPPDPRLGPGASAPTAEPAEPAPAPDAESLLFPLDAEEPGERRSPDDDPYA